MINRGRLRLFAQDQAEYCTRAVDLVRQSTVIDMLGLVTLNFKKLWGWQADPTSFRSSDLEKLKGSGITVFHPAVGYNSGDIYAASLKDITGWNTFIAAHESEFLRVDRAADLERAKESGKIGILIGQQNSSHFRSVDDVDRFYNLGQRLSQLTYHQNRIGYGSSAARDGGLSDYGAQIVARMNQVGMAADISHCGDRTTLDALEASRKPVLVTHSNCRALASHRRCKTDEAIRKMAAKGGVMGVTMVRSFVRDHGPTTVEHVLDHIDHIARLAGIEHAGIGSDVDLDGRDNRIAKPKYDLDGMRYAKKIYDLTEGLVRRKYSDPDIELFLGGNFQRALIEICDV